jgi:hypothetical protein
LCEEGKMKLEHKTEPLKAFHVVGFDPGGTTGWARAWYKPSLLDAAFPNSPDNVEMSDIYLECGQFIDPHHEELYKFMKEQVEYYPELPPEFVSEPFEYRQFARQAGDDIGRTKVNLISCEYIGIMRLVAAQTGTSLYTGFNAGEAKSYVTNDKLNNMGWLQRPITPKRHMNDALRQVVKYLIVKKLVRHPITTCWTDDI